MLDGATAQNQQKDNYFLSKPFAARYVEFRPTARDAGGHDICARFELYGCSYGMLFVSHLLMMTIHNKPLSVNCKSLITNFESTKNFEDIVNSSYVLLSLHQKRVAS